jgi:hypothetical protein
VLGPEVHIGQGVLQEPRGATNAPKPSRRPLLVRVLRGAIRVLVVLAVTYLVGMNVFLSTSLFARVVDAEADTIDIHYRSGWSVVPGRIHAKGLSIRGRDSHVDWILRLDDAEFDMSFAALVKKRFDVSRVRGTRISFRLRRRLDAPPTAPGQVADLPPIEGFGAYSVRPHAPPSPDVWSDAAYHLWTAHLEHILAEDVREVWVDRIRFEGSARITGRFYFKPLRVVDVGPVYLEVGKGSVHAGAAALVDALDGSSADITLARLDPRTADFLHHVSLGLEAHGICPNMVALPLPLPEGVTLEGAAEVRRLALQMKNGILAADSHLDARAPGVVVTRGDHRFEAPLALAGDIAPADGHDRLDFRIDMSAFTVARAIKTHAADGAFLRAERTVATGDSRELDLARPFEDLHVVVEMTEGQLADARDVSFYIPKKTPVALLRGRARAEARLEVWFSDKRAMGRGSLRAEDLDVRLAKMRVRGATSVQASFASWRWETNRLEDAVLAVRVSHGSLAWDRTPDAPLVQVTNLLADAHGADADLADPLRALDVAIAIPEGSIADSDLPGAYLPLGSAMKIAMGRFSIACTLVIADHVASGTLDLQSKRLRLAYRDLELAADVRARARVHAWRWERGDLALDQAAVDVTAISVSRRGPAPSAESALSVGRIALRAKSPHFVFSDPLGKIELDASIVDGKVDDPSVANALLPPGSTFAIEADSGRLSSEIDAKVTRRIAHGTVALRAENMGVSGKAVRVRGDTELSGEVSDWDLEKNTMTVLDSRVLVTRVKGSFRDHVAPEFGADRVELSGRIRKLDLLRPTLGEMDGRLVVANAVIADARSLQALLPADGIVTIESGHGRASADVELSGSKGKANGVVDVVLAHSGVRFHETHFVGDFRAIAHVDGFDVEQPTVDLSGSTLEMRNVQVTNASTETSSWSGDALLQKATFRWDPQPEFDAWLALDARDASPLLAALLRNDLPKVFAGLTNMPSLLASARLTVGAHHLALRDVDARGGDLALHGLYVIRGDHRRGAFILDKGILSMGLHLGDEGSHVRFFGLDGWLRDEARAAMRTLEEGNDAALLHATGPR